MSNGLWKPRRKGGSENEPINAKMVGFEVRNAVKMCIGKNKIIQYCVLCLSGILRHGTIWEGDSMLKVGVGFVLLVRDLSKRLP